MSARTMKLNVLLAVAMVLGLLFAAAPGQVMAADLSVCATCTYTTIQSAIDAATAGDIITVAAGTYTEYLQVNKSVSILGAGIGQTLINVGGLNAPDGAGIYVSANNVTLQGFTLDGADNGTPRYGLKFGAVSGGIVSAVRVEDIFRSGFDLLGTSSTSLTGIQSISNGGHGLALSDANGITITDLIASGNLWSSVSVATWGHYSPLGTSGIVFSGTNTFDGVFQLEEGDFAHPGVPPSGDAVITYSTTSGAADVTVQASDFGFALHGDQDDAPGQNRVYFFKTLGEAQTAAAINPLGHMTGTGRYIESLTDSTQLYVIEGMSIQTAIDAATSGDTINVFPGNYNETASDRSLYDGAGPYQFGLFFGAGKDDLTVRGVGATGTPITTYLNVAAHVKTNATNSFGNSGIFVEANNITIQGLDVQENIPGDNKTIEVIGNGFSFYNNVFSLTYGGSLYINDWRYDAGNSYIESFDIANNWFMYGGSVDIASGVGVDGDVAARKITGNKFTGNGSDVYWAQISFNGIVPAVGWFTHPVGGAVITGNTFEGIQIPIRSRGTVEEADFNWTSYWENNTFDKAVVALDPDGKPRAYTYTSDSTTFENTRRIGTSINLEMGNAQAGDTILVGPGTYSEALIINKADLTFESSDGADVTIIDVPDGALTVGVKVLKNLGVVTFDGFTVKDFTEAGIVQPFAERVGTTFHVLNNTVVPAGTYLRNGIQVAGTGSTVIGNYVVGAYLTTDWASTGIHVVNASDVLVEGNTVTGELNGMDYGIAVDNWDNVVPVGNVTIRNNIVLKADYSVLLAAYAAGSTVQNVTIENNQLTQYVDGLFYDGTIGTVDASPNWWGSILGPDAETIATGAEIEPWCGNASCSFLVNSNPSGQALFLTEANAVDVQEALDNVPEGTTLVLPPGQLKKSGGFNISTPDLTIILQQGTIIENESPCFTVSADYTTITATSKLAAQCIPDAGSDGIEVTKPITNLVVENIEFVGTDGTHGMHFDFVMTDLLIKDNYIHGFAGNGLLFEAQPAGVIDIHGNLFFDNDLNGIESGELVIPATFNSWGHVDGATAGDGVSSGVEADPWTHVDLYMTSSGSPVANTVAKNNTITYTVYGNFANTMGVDFALVYPSDLTLVPASLTPLGAFDFDPTFNTATLNRIGFKASSLTAVDGTQPLFSVTFTGTTAVVNALMDLDSVPESFAMGPAGSSTNVYATILVDGQVTVIDRFSITGTVSMQGRTTRAGVELLLAQGILMHYGPFQTTSANVLSSNFTIANLVADTYLFTTNQPRYLNVTTTNAKNIVLGADVTLQPLELKGGDAFVDNMIDVSDATVIGGLYGTGTIADSADINFDNKVDIFDLAMVGGNFGLSSAVYNSWVPVLP